MASFSHAAEAVADGAEAAAAAAVEALPDDDDVEAAAENWNPLTWTTPMQTD
jgi:hypothetical protein